METKDLKRCSGTTYPGDKTRVLTEPHMEPRENFNKNSAKPDGLDHRCKSCKSVVNAERKKLPKIAPPEFMLCRTCGESKHHSEMANNNSNRNGKANICSDCNNSIASKWQKSNPEKANAKSSEWKKRNPEKNRAKTQRYMDRKRSQPNEDVSKEVLLEIHGNLCYLCGKPVPENIGDWDMEHVIPTSRGQLGTTYENCRVAHSSCNRSKGPKTYFEYEIQRSTHYVTIENLYLFNEVYEWHMETFWAELRKNQPHLLKGTDELTVP